MPLQDFLVPAGGMRDLDGVLAAGESRKREESFIVGARSQGAAEQEDPGTSDGRPAFVDDPNPSNNSATDVTSVLYVADFEITKDNGVVSVAPGDELVYTIRVENLGPSSIGGGIMIADSFPGELIDCQWTCADTSGARPTMRDKKKAELKRTDRISFISVPALEIFHAVPRSIHG